MTEKLCNLFWKVFGIKKRYLSLKEKKALAERWFSN